jgi:hypothetical protein
MIFRTAKEERKAEEGKKKTQKKEIVKTASNVERWIFRTAKEGRNEEEREKRNSKIKTVRNAWRGKDLKVLSGQIGSAREWYHWKAL